MYEYLLTHKLHMASPWSSNDATQISTLLNMWYYILPFSILISSPVKSFEIATVLSAAVKCSSKKMQLALKSRNSYQDFENFGLCFLLNFQENIFAHSKIHYNEVSHLNIQMKGNQSRHPHKHHENQSSSVLFQSSLNAILREVVNENVIRLHDTVLTSSKK